MVKESYETCTEDPITSPLFALDALGYSVCASPCKGNACPYSSNNQIYVTGHIDFKPGLYRACNYHTLDKETTKDFNDL